MSVFVKVWGVNLMGDLPERWFEGDIQYRCSEGHVSPRTLKSGESGYLCRDCRLPVLVTFPEDTEESTLGAEVFAIRWYFKTREERMPIGSSD